MAPTQELSSAQRQKVVGRLLRKQEPSFPVRGSQSHQNLTAFCQPGPQDVLGHRMWFSKGEEAYALTSNDFFLLTSIQSLCSLSLYAPICTHMSTHTCAHTDMRAHIVA